MLETYQNRHHFLQTINPTIKLGGLLAVIFCMVFVFDPWTPLLLFIFTLLATTGLGGVPMLHQAKILSPFLLFALSFVWISILFPDERGDTVLFQIGPLPVALENVMTGLSLGLRSLVFASWSLLFVFTTDPTKLVLSFMQHLKLPPRFGFGMMAAYRFLPLFQREFQQIRTAHRIRGANEEKGWRNRFKNMKRYAIPLLAGAIRKAERVAVAMESKGFDGSRDRSYYHIIPWTRKDFGFAVGFVIVLASLFTLRRMWV